MADEEKDNLDKNNNMNEGNDPNQDQSQDQGQDQNQNQNEQLEQEGGSKITKGMLIIGLIIFVAVLFGIQKYIHFDKNDRHPADPKHASLKNEAPSDNAIMPDAAKMHEEHGNDVTHQHGATANSAVPAPDATKQIRIESAPAPLPSNEAAVPTVPIESAVPTSTAPVAAPHSVAAPTATDNNLVAKNDKQVEEVVRKYIESNPEVVAKALQNLNAKMSKDRDGKSKDYIKNNIQKIYAGKPYLGNPAGKSVVVEYFDYKCSYCRRSHLVLERVIKDYPDVKVVLVPVPVLGQNSAEAARAAVAVWILSPANFATFHENLINSPTISLDTILAIARKIGLSTDALTAKMNSPEVEALINENLDSAQGIGMKGVPTFIVNEELIPGSLSYEGFKEELSKAPVVAVQ